MTTDRVVVQERNNANVLVVPAEDGSPERICAISDAFVLLEEIPWVQMQQLVTEYCEIHDRELRRFLLAPADTHPGSPMFRPAQPLKQASRKAPEVFSIDNMAAPGTGASKRPVGQVSGRYCRTPVLRDAICSAGLEHVLSKPSEYTDAWSIVLEPYETQLNVAELVVDSDISGVSWSQPRSRLDEYASGKVSALLQQSESTQEFLIRVCQPLCDWFADPVRAGARGSDTFGTIRPLALAWFAVWLARRGAILFPQTVLQRAYELFPRRHRLLGKAVSTPDELLADESAFLSKVQRVVAHVGDRAAERAEMFLRNLDLMMPGALLGHFSAKAIAHVLTLKTLISNDKATLTHLWSLEANRLKETGLSARRLQQLTNLVNGRRRARRDQDTPAWGWLDGEAFTRLTTDRYSRDGFLAGPNLSSHAQEMRRLFPAIAGKSGSSRRGHLNIYFSFLATLPDDRVPTRILDLTPKLIDSLARRDDVATLRGYMVTLGLTSVRQGHVLSTLKKAWKLAQIEAPEQEVVCPISDQLRSAYGEGHYRNGMTTRRSIDMEILELLIEENRKDDFRFSRERSPEKFTRSTDSRVVTDSQSGATEAIWWPGPAILMDLLLHIPMRSKQGRYLDSGEGDEFRFDPETLTETVNTLPTMTHGRHQGFIRRVSMSPLRDEPGIGMYINTNKTGRDYVFPWLPPDLAFNAQRVIDWQKRYNPMGDPIPDQRVGSGEQITSDVLVYPIFRDPTSHEHEPISTGYILSYFRQLLKHVEEKYNLANKTSIRFFRENGEAIYDIHSLRVTGVTRLLALGVEPKIVRMLVGHSSLAMTWYYEHITNQRVSAAMQQALESRRPSRQTLLQMSEVERQEFFARLFCKDDDYSAGKSLALLFVEQKSPFLDLRVDGICPGQDCADAGVWRTRACSLCKFNVTGVPFLAGLEMVLNDLMAEIVLNQQRLSDLRDELYRRRVAGETVGATSAEIIKVEELVDNLVRQWEAQFQYVKRSEADLQAWLAVPESDKVGNEQLLTRLISPDPQGLGMALKESHHLMLFAGLVEGAKHVEGFSPAIGVREVRDELLLEIARHDNKAALFFKLDQKARRLALDAFAALLLDRDPSVTEVQSLIDGTCSLAQMGMSADAALAARPPVATLAELTCD